MFRLSGYDSDAVGFDSVSQDSRPNKSSSSQTTEFHESGAGSQTNISKDSSCMVRPEDLYSDGETLKEYPAPGLNEFLRRVVPAMLEQLDQNDKEFINNSSDSDEEEVLNAKLLQEIKLPDGSGDHQSVSHRSVLGVTWSSTGNSLAVSLGQMQHETWCQNTGVIKIFTLKRSEDRFVHAFDVAERNCVTVLKYHPTISALLAYGTASGEVVLCNLMNGCLDESTQLASPSGCHGSRRVSYLHWADASLANKFLMMQINSKGKRRGAADQVLLTAGSDGTLNVWQVNPNLKVFENIVCFTIKQNIDLTCFDFVRTSPLHAVEERASDGTFVVGSKTGTLFLCKIQSTQVGDVCDPVYDVLEGHATCVLDVAFGFQRPTVFASISMDSELRIYDINQRVPLKVLCLDAPISCMGWLASPCLVIGLVGSEEQLRVYNACSGRVVPVSGFTGRGDIYCIAVNHSGCCRIAACDDSATVRIWELPARRIKLYAHDLDF